MMADQPEHPPHRFPNQIGEPANDRSIHRVEKRATTQPEPRPKGKYARASDAPSWRRWLNSKMV